MANEAPTFMIEDARIVFRNFSGKEDEFNREGSRNFLAILDPVVAERMLDDGWNVKYFKPKPDDDPNDPLTPFIQVSVNFKQRPPKIVMVTSAGRTHLSEDNVDVLDWVDFSTVDIICRAYDWAVNGKTGRKAYLKTMFATIDEDDLERKYAEAPKSPPATPHEEI